ncbi:MAG: hypothetical protein HKN68_01915 [Saprospiraceae bacterium]|nr:hypothetical protein [Saprospiraceae bacterium]
MKNLLLAATLIMLAFLSCSKDDTSADTMVSPDTTVYEGTWRGTFSGASSGTWIWNVTEKGTLTGTVTVGNGTMYAESGSVTESGVVTTRISNGGTADGQFNADRGTYAGTWQNNDSNNPLSGTSIGTKD